GDDGGQGQRQRDPGEGAPRRRTEIAGGFEQAVVHAGQPGADDDGDETDREGNVGDQDGNEAERQVEDLAEEEEQRDAEQDFRHRHRGQDQEGQQARPPAVHGEAGHGAEHGGDAARDHGDEQRIGGGLQHGTVAEQVTVPGQGEALPGGVQLRVVEGKQDDDG